MAEVENVVVRVEAQGTASTSAQLAAVGTAAKTLQSRINGTSQSFSKLSGSMSASTRQTKQNLKATTDLTERYKILENHMNRASKASGFFTRNARKLFFAVIGLGIEFAITAGSLMAVNAAFAIGNALVKAYKWSMGGVAAATASVAAALSIAAAAQREYTAAQVAHTQKATPNFGSAMDYSMAMIRNLTSDTQLAVFGVESLNAAFAAVSKNSQFTGKSQAVIRALRDFAAIGGDPGKNLASIGDFVGLLQKEGKVTSKVTAAAQAIGPEFEKAFKKIKKGGGGVQEIFQSILSGDMSKSAGISGQADLLSGTLFGMFKKYKTLLTGLFGDIGQTLLGPAKDSLEKIFNTIKNGLLRVSPSITAFGKVMLPTIVKAVEKLTEFTVTLFNKYLPQSEGMLGQIREFYIDFKNLFRNITESLNKLRDGGSIVIDMFAKPLKELFKGIGENVEAFAQLAVDNKDDFIAFGNSLGGVVDALMDFAQKFKEAFVAALPTINAILSVVEKIIKAVGMLIKGMSILPFGGELIAGIAGYGMIKGSRGGQRRARNQGRIPRGRMGNMAGAVANTATALMGAPYYAGQGFQGLDDAGQVVGGTQAATDAARGRLKNKGFFSSRIFKNGRNGRLLDAASVIGGQLNPMGSSRAAMNQFDDLNNFAVQSHKKGEGPTAPFPGAKYDPVTMTYYGDERVPNPNKLTGVKGKLARARAGMMGGFSVGGAIGGASIAAFANSGLAPSMMSENAGAINLGAGLMAFNPVAGAGVMGAGTLMNLAQGKGARTATGGALTGAASGAALGGSLTAMFGPGAGIGIVAGAMIGAIVGHFSGQKAEQQAAKAAAKSFAYQKLGDAVSKMIVGDTKGSKGAIGKLVKESDKFNAMNPGQQDGFITNLQRQGILDRTQAERARENKGTFGGELARTTAMMQQQTMSLSNSFENLMTGLQGSTGMSRKAIMDLAHSMGVNLYEPTLTLTDAIKGLGAQMDLTVQGLAQSGTDALLKSYSFIDELRKKEKTSFAVSAAAKGIQQAGTGTRDQYLDLLQKSSELLASSNPDDPLAQLYGLQSSFGEGGGMFNAGSALGSVGRGDFVKNVGPQYNELIRAQSGNLATTRARGITQLINESNLEFSNGGAGFAGIQSQLQTMYQSSDPAKQKQARGLENFLASGSSLGGNSSEIQKKLAEFGITLGAGGALKESTAGTISQQLSKGQEDMRNSIVDAIGSGFSDRPAWWTGRPDWWGNKGTNTKDPDTSSPRTGRVGDTVSSRLGRTMSRHNQFNSMLTGKRTITSAWRNHSLGSPSSDHVTGNAYDLTGQNLGQYSTMIKNAGGFAEFHGAAGSRHLHVVPPAGPSGDTGTSRIGMAAPTASPQVSGGAVTINVYASEGQNEQAIARMVMDEINRSQRNYKERK
jgi:hypothetical protein